MPPERRLYEHDAQELEVSYRTNRDGSLDFGDCNIRVFRVDDGWVDFEETGKRHRVHVFRNGSTVWVHSGEGDVGLRERPRFPEAAREAEVPGGLVAPMPGKVVSVSIEAGQSVQAGDLLMIVEAMKMEHRVLAPYQGTVHEVRANPGEQV